MDATVICWFVTYCHLPKISLWRLRRFTKSQSHLNSTNPATALCTWRIDSHQTTCHRVCSFTHSASHHPSLHPLLVPTGRFWGPRPSLSAASTAAPAARSCSTAAVWPCRAARCSGVQPQAPKGSETSTAGGLHPVALHRPPLHLSGRGSNLRSEVREFYLFPNCIASWFNGSHYRCWCL